MDNELIVSRIDTDSQRGSYRQPNFKGKEKAYNKKDMAKSLDDEFSNTFKLEDYESKVFDKSDVLKIHDELNDILGKLEDMDNINILISDIEFHNISGLVVG